MSLAILDARGLEAWYGPVRALHGLDFEVDDGGVTAVLGANGAGKTTILRALSGLIRRAGEIRFRGRPIGALAGRSATLLRPNSSISASARSAIFPSSRRASGRLSALARNPPLAIACAPTHTFWRTVMVENKATFWNVLATPSETSS